MWIVYPLAPFYCICGMSTIADLCIPCHILIVLWTIMEVMLWIRVVYISYSTVSWCPLHLCHTCLIAFNHSWCSDLVILPYSRVFYYPLAFSHGVCGISILFVHIAQPHLLTCLVVLLILYHFIMSGRFWWSCFRYMWIVLPEAPSHCFCGMSIFAELCIPCHILIVLWIIMAVVLWTRVVYISYATVSWCPLHLCLTCSINTLSLCSTGLIWWLCHRHMWITYRIV